MGQSLSYLPCAPSSSSPEDEAQQGADQEQDEEGSPPKEVIGTPSGGSKSLKLQKSMLNIIQKYC